MLGLAGWYWKKKHASTPEHIAQTDTPTPAELTVHGDWVGHDKTTSAQRGVAIGGHATQNTIITADQIIVATDSVLSSMGKVAQKSNLREAT